MTFEELDEMWHKIREKQAAERRGLTLEETVARNKRKVRETAERLGLRIAKSSELIGNRQ
jgi:hypothetical protein